ncbi:MAG: glucose-6-phosphate dehydrogenase assembly protein OpcA [Acidobacteriota bacterium]
MASPVDDSPGIDRLTEGEELPVDSASIEKSLSELWRNQSEDDDHAVTRAALWNVIAHTGTAADRTSATETLGRTSAEVPQRTIIIQSSSDAPAELTSWISANCHLVGGERQVCSEEVSIVAGGHRVQHVPSLVNALLIPDMPVAAWWVGDLPSGQDEYVVSLFEPADLFLYDSVRFDSIDDLRLVEKLSLGTDTLPADLNWIRLEDWRLATATIFDPPSMRAQLRAIRSVRIVAAGSGTGYFGERIEPLLYAAWLSRQLGHAVQPDQIVNPGAGQVRYAFDYREDKAHAGRVLFVEIEFVAGGRAVIEEHSDGSALVSRVEGFDRAPSAVTRSSIRGMSDLIVRQLSYRDEDRLFPQILPLATALAAQEQE